MKIAINSDYGGFSLSPEATELYASKKGIKIYWFSHDLSNDDFHRVDRSKAETGLFAAHACTVENPDRKNSEHFFSQRPDYGDRADSDLIATIEELGLEKASGRYASLTIVEIPDDIEWTIEEYDGIEWVSEKHRTWQ